MSEYALRRAGEDGRTRLIGALVAFAMVLGLVTVGTVAQAVHDAGSFELDKNASDNLNVDPVGYLNSNITATATAINVCQTGAVPAVGDLILIRAERMTVTANDAGNFGGNCPGTKRTYTVARGADSTTAASQSGGANNIGARVSLLAEGDETSKPGVDWDEVFKAWTANPATTCAALGLVECTFIHDGIGPSTFTGGNTKDHLPVSGWKHTSGASPDKGEILNAYAAKAIDGNDQILYFGMDRYAVDGSTDIGFWFFQAEIGLEGDGSFSGSQTDGDILILATFTQGGAATNVRVFKWEEGAGTVLTNISAGPVYGDCVGADPGDGGCATVNDTTIDVPWNFTFKGDSVGKWIPAGGFFEGGINLTQAGLEGCYSSFMAETRSSPELTAVLKDFALGSFEACASGLVTTPADGDGNALTDSNDNDIPDIYMGSSGVDVRDSAVLNIVGTSTWSGTLRFFLCGPLLDASATCATGGVEVGANPIAVSSADSSYTYLSAVANLTAVGRYCWRGEFTSATDGVPSVTDQDALDGTDGECFEVLQLQPTMSTAQSFVPNDSATVTVGSGGGNLAGSVVFKLYVNDATCTDPAAYTSGGIDITTGSGSGLSKTVMSANTTAYSTSGTTFHWVVEYTSTNSAHKNVTSGCGVEVSSITIDNNATPPADD